MSALGRAADLLGAEDELRYRCTLVAEAGEEFRLEFHVVRVSMAGLAPGDGYDDLPWCPECEALPAQPVTPEPVATAAAEQPAPQAPVPPDSSEAISEPRPEPASSEPRPEPPADPPGIRPWSFDDDDEPPPGWTLRWQQGAP